MTEPIFPTAAAPSGAGGADVGHGLQAVIVVRAVGMAALRRRFGRAWAEALGNRLAHMLTALVGPARLVVAANDRVDLDLVDSDHDAVAAAIRAIAALFAAPLAIGGETVMIDVAIGAAVGSGAPADDVHLAEEAEEACGEAQRSGTAVIRAVASSPLGAGRHDFAADLARAIPGDELLLVYQPKVHLRRREITSLEALIRWRHPTRGLILPGDFIPLAEETGEIAAMTLWVLGRVVADQRELRANGHDLTVYINVAGVLLTDAAFIERACAAIAASGVPIGFEITETSVIRDPAAAIGNLNRFAAMGIPIAIDDYGAGLSSLAYLKQLPARELKIDKLFVTQLTSSHRDPLIVRSTIDLAHALEMEVVAEGIESSTALALLSVMGCDVGQGYFIGRPLDLAATLGVLDRHRHGWVEEEAPRPLSRLRAAARRG